MKYISLNHNSAPTSFRDAVINGLAPDKGLYFPEEEICLSSKLLKSLNNIDDVELCYEVIKDYIGNEIPKNRLIDIIYEQFSWLYTHLWLQRLLLKIHPRTYLQKLLSQTNFLKRPC